MPIINTTVPNTLKRICTTPVRLASFPVPIEHTMAVVTQVPRLIPIITGYTSEKDIAPVEDRA